MRIARLPLRTLPIATDLGYGRPSEYAGHVVAVVERMPGQLFSGVLGLLRPSSAVTKEKQEAERREREGPGAAAARPAERPKIVWFKVCS